ncbi:MAG: sensor histidine kinase [Methyloligellaceae bacterium]
MQAQRTNEPMQNYLSLASAMWRGLDLTRQFTIASAVVLLIGMVTIGFWVARQIEDRVIQNTAVATALYMDSIVEPLLQELAEKDTLSDANRKALQEILMKGPLSKGIVAIKIWKKGGLIAYSNNSEIIGSIFPETDILKRALKGQLSVEFDELNDLENEAESRLNIPLLEIYSPVRQFGSGNIIGAAEFYTRASRFQKDLRQSIAYSWIVVGVVTTFMLLGLFGIVRQGARVIQWQRTSLERQIARLSDLLEENRKLQRRVDRAQQRTSELNERYLHKIGADLHDGPAQLLSLALLRFDYIRGIFAKLAKTKSEKIEDLDTVHRALTDCMAEIRMISSGLTLPRIENSTLEDVVASAAKAHERRTGTTVETRAGVVASPVSNSLKVCVYRFVQEGLNNSHQHANGSGQIVELKDDGKSISLSVTDNGPGFDADLDKISHGRLGLLGLRSRVEALGGTFQISSRPDNGTTLLAEFPKSVLAAQHDP